jgi:ribulose-phosphate 3-epimerase
MVRTARRIEPRRDVAEAYTQLYDGVYRHLPDAIRPVVHAIAALRGGSSTDPPGGARTLWSGSASSPLQQQQQHHQQVISPSLLAADWSCMRDAIDRCVEAKCNQIHVDVFDGVYLNSPRALTFGPQMIKSLRDYADSTSHKDLILDVHLCVDRPLRYVQALADAGSSRVIFMWEAFGGIESAVNMATAVNDAGMACGVSINPETNEEDILPLLETGLVDLVDVLAVEPGFGGQQFQEVAIAKLENLRAWRDTTSTRGPAIQLLVDGGINSETAPRVRAAGADILVAGSFLFGHRTSLKAGVNELNM